MHELAVCQGLIAAVERVAARERAGRVTGLTVKLGALCGVEPSLLENAFAIARAGTIAATANLTIAALPVRIACDACGDLAEVPAGRLLCPRCASWQVRVVAGEELELARVEFERGGANVRPAPAIAAALATTRG